MSLWPATAACKADVGGVLGVKDSMIVHILGKEGSIPCQNTSVEAWKTAKALKSGKEKQGWEDSSSDSDNGSKKKLSKKKLLTKVEKQSQLKVFQGIHIPFTPEQEDVICERFLQATISANLPFCWVQQESGELLKCLKLP